MLSAVPQSSKLVDVGHVTTENSTTTVQLQAGHLQLLQDGEYNVFEPTVNDSDIFLGNHSENEFWVGAIEVHEKDIGMVSAGACVIEQREGKEILVSVPLCSSSMKCFSRVTQAHLNSKLKLLALESQGNYGTVVAFCATRYQCFGHARVNNS